MMALSRQIGEPSMAKMTERSLRARDAKRNLGAELLASVRRMKSGKVGHVHRVTVAAIAEARARSGLFAAAICRTVRRLATHVAGVGAGLPFSYPSNVAAPTITVLPSMDHRLSVSLSDCLVRAIYSSKRPVASRSRS
jgi:hypothetical protein